MYIGKKILSARIRGPADRYISFYINADVRLFVTLSQHYYLTEQHVILYSRRKRHIKKNTESFSSRIEVIYYLHLY